MLVVAVVFNDRIHQGEFMIRHALLPIALLLMLTSTAPAREIKRSEDLIREMHDRYAKSWYKTLTFVQKTTHYEQDGTSKRYFLQVPANMRTAREAVAWTYGLPEQRYRPSVRT